MVFGQRLFLKNCSRNCYFEIKIPYLNRLKNRKMSNDELFGQLSFYTLSHPDSDYFIHQMAVDAYTAQTATEDTKQIGLVFTLVGLYLFAEKNFTGKEI